MAAKDIYDKKVCLYQCNNCGRRITDSQARLEVYNTRHRNYEYYHEEWQGCYESTRETGRRVLYHTYHPLIAAITYREALAPIDSGYAT